jgi:hypothetical protein
MASSMSLAYFPTDRRQPQILEICRQLGRDQGRCSAYATEREACTLVLSSLRDQLDEELAALD